MKRINSIRLVLLCIVTICSLAFYQNGSLQKAHDDTPEEENITVKRKRGAGDIIIWESISRYFVAASH
jgi:hypothetical protein